MWCEPHLAQSSWGAPASSRPSTLSTHQGEQRPEEEGTDRWSAGAKVP